MEKPPVLENINKDSKKERIFEMFGGEPEAIFVLSGALTEKSEAGKYKSSSFSIVDQEQKMVTGGKDRVIAAAEANKYFPNAKVITYRYNWRPERSY